MEQQPNMEASGIQTNPEVASGATDAIAPKADQVAYDTHRKLLGEKKALQAKAGIITSFIWIYAAIPTAITGNFLSIIKIHF